MTWKTLLQQSLRLRRSLEKSTVADLEDFPLDDDLSFGSVLQQQAEIKENLDDLSEFDLDMDLGAGAVDKRRWLKMTSCSTWTKA